MEGLTRSEVAKQCGVNIESLRYYEKRRLIDPPPRTPAGYRMYSREDAVKIGFIKNARNLGFTLNEINDLMKLRVDRKKSCDSVLVKARNKRKEVDQKIRDLKSMRKTLDQLIGKCEKSVLTNDCPILSSFESAKPGKKLQGGDHGPQKD